MTAQQASRSNFEPGTLVGNKYRIVSLIGIGGVGRVYLARHIELETEVAIKVLRPEMVDRPEVVQRFGREARASVRLHSERIARVLDVGTHEGKPYFVMEYMVGCNLLEARQQADIDIATLCEFFIQACEGLADAHAQGVVHRDIKPENLFVARDASGWRSLKIFDFGISKFSLTGRYSDVDLAAMRTEAMMGTPHYISPEQIRSTRDVDHRTDIWSLGAVMFEVLSGGILPFREEREVTALVAEVLERPHRSLLDVAPNVPERLAAIVDRCLAKDRRLRYQTVAEVALDLLPLAPARARASAERAVSVMQAAGLMPLNGDMESLRPTQVTVAERSRNYVPRSAPGAGSAPPVAPVSGPRPSDSPRVSSPTASTLPPAPASGSSATSTVSPGAPPPMSPAPTGAPSQPPVSASPAALGTPPPITRRPPPANPAPVSSAEPALEAPAPPGPALPLARPIQHSIDVDLVDDDFDPDLAPLDQAKKRNRKLALIVGLIGLLLLGLVVVLSTQGGPPERARAAPPVVAQALPQSPAVTSVTPASSETELPEATPSATALPSITPSAEHKSAPKVTWSPPRPVALPPVAKPPSATKPTDLPSATATTTRPELRRER